MTRGAALALLAALLTLTGCLPRPAAPGSLPVVASFYPLYAFAARVGGATATVGNMLPTGVAPHDYEVTPQDLVALSKAKLFIYNGAQLETWVPAGLRQLPGGVVVVDATAGLPLHTQNGTPDPHVWLDPVLAARQVDNIREGFARADSRRRDVYAANAAGLQGDLQALHARYTQALQRCGQRTIVTAHAAFGYLARRYGLAMVPITGLSPEAEPSPARLKEVVLLVRKYRVNVIYFETLTSPRVAETIAREVGARTAVLNPLEGLTAEEQRQGRDYITVMNDNLEQLAQGLACR